MRFDRWHGRCFLGLFEGGLRAVGPGCSGTVFGQANAHPPLATTLFSQQSLKCRFA